MRSSRPRNGESAQAATEFAIFVPILCLLLVAVIQYGMMIWTSMDLASATRDAARRAAVARHDQNPTASVTSSFNGSLDHIDPTDAQLTITGGWDQGDDVTVTATTPYSLDIVGIEVWDGNLRAESVVTIG